MMDYEARKMRRNGLHHHQLLDIPRAKNPDKKNGWPINTFQFWLNGFVVVVFVIYFLSKDFR